MLFYAIYSLIEIDEGYKQIAQNSLAGLTREGDFFVLGSSLLTLIIGYLIYYIFMAIGLSVIAKRKNNKHWYFAFIPFASTYLLGEIVGKVTLFRKEIKNLGVLTMIAEILYFISVISLDASTSCYNILYKFITGEINVITKNDFGDINVVSFTTITINEIINVVALVLKYMLFWSFIRQYAGRRAMQFFIFSVLQDFLMPVGFLTAIFVFVVRNKEKDLYRPNVGYYGNFYGGYNSYNSQEQFFRNNPYRENNQKPEDPFSEFGGGDTNGKNNDNNGNPFSDF